MTDIRPIETIYRGHRFRSRLEARWAVFFNHCRESYQYEAEGFQLPSGWYLPDFYFPRRRAFAEIKPTIELPVYHFEFQYALGRPVRDDFPRAIVLMNELFRGLKLADHHAVVLYGDPFEVIAYDGGGAVHFDHDGPRCGIGFIDLFPASLFEAADVARAARFEHER